MDDNTDSNKDGISDAYTKAIVGGAIATYFSGVLKHYFIYIAILITIMIILSVISVITKPTDNNFQDSQDE